MLVKHTKKLIIILIAAIVISIPISMLFGSASLDIHEVIGVILNKFDPDNHPLDNMNLQTIVWNLRLPRILLAIAVGVGLSICGVSMQAVTRNAMAEPYTLGIASGASAMAAFYISRIEGVVESLWGVNAFAFLGAILAMVLIYSLAARKSYATNYKLILTGIVIGMVFNSIREFIIATTANPNKVNNIVLWEMGGFGAARWDNILPAIIIATLGVTALIILSEQLNLMSVGEQTATTLGVSIKSLQRWIIVITSLVTGTMVASSGIISFVGLIVPHIVRKLVGSEHQKVIPVSALGGALLLIWTDVLARTIIAPKELGIAVLTSLVGGPLLIILMRKDVAKG